MKTAQRLERPRDAVVDEQFPFDSFFSSPWFYEFCPKGQNKEAGITWLAKISRHC